MKKVSLLGATGSIGMQTLDIIRKDENIELISVSANKSWEKIIDIINEFNPKYAVLMEENAYQKVTSYCSLYKQNTEVLLGMEGLSFISTLDEVDIVVTAIVGMIGIRPTLDAISAGKDIALANKETLVAAGQIVMAEAKKRGVNILPVDSEHGAIFQSLQGNNLSEVSRIILTASGGPFRGKKLSEFANIPKTEALRHPKWNMGSKISIDSATMMNKGLEVIEAHWLFSQSYENIKILVHPESIVHSMVEYIDGSVIAQLAVTDMRLPIQYALNYPLRRETVVENLNLAKVGKLTFEEPDFENFPCLRLAYNAGKTGGLMPSILNIANEVAVSLYLTDRISFGKIYYIIEECMNKFEYNKEVTLDNILDIQKNISEYLLKKYN